MCGIAGSISISRNAGVRRADAGLMSDALRHRGPDADGLWSDGMCTLAHRRLAIIDLSEAGRQPMSNEDGSVWITYNGEIYSYQSLREELVSLGHQFRTRTDTECIVHAYEQWGEDCVTRLRGMFAFAIWDQRNRSLFLARDRVGKKPLFYTQLQDGFTFASELQGVLANPRIPRIPDLEAIDAYMTWGYVPAPLTGFRGISKLPPAHTMTVDMRSGAPVVRTQRYWSLSYSPKLEITEQDAIEAIREKLTEAVRLRMIGDVPLGAFLSGGIDSSIVVGLMAGLSSSPVKTFSIGFDDAAFDELNHADRIAEKWGTDHHRLVVKPDALSILPRLVRHYGEPYADSSAIPTYYVSEITRRSVTVALNGDGGDESFAGYSRYYGNRLANRIRSMPGARLASLAIAGMLPTSRNPKSKLRQARRFLDVAHRPMAERYGRWLTYFTDSAKTNLYSDDLSADLSLGRSLSWMEELFARTAGMDPVDAAMAVDVDSYLPYDLLVKVDITSMANSLEARSPFLDHEVMEFAARLPSQLKLRGRESKYLLRRAFPDLLPPENTNRPKMGFGVPVGQWFRGELRDLLDDALLSQRSLDRGYFRPDELNRTVNEHVSGAADHGPQLWSLLMLELWHREMVDSAMEPRSGVQFALATG